MRLLSVIVTITLLLPIARQSRAEEATASVIAMAIAKDCGNPSENYVSYAEALAKTLSFLSSEQFSKVFEGTGVTPPEEGDDTNDSGK